LNAAGADTTTFLDDVHAMGSINTHKRDAPDVSHQYARFRARIDAEFTARV
jgi:hypothetical protein